MFKVFHKLSVIFVVVLLSSSVVRCNPAKRTVYKLISKIADFFKDNSTDSAAENYHPDHLVEPVPRPQNELMNRPYARRRQKPYQGNVNHAISVPSPIPVTCKQELSTWKPKIKTNSNGQEVTQKITNVIRLTHSNVMHDGEKKVPNRGLRPIIIDGLNVAYRYGNGEFKIRGVLMVIEYFLNRGHTEVVCFIPAHFRHRCKTTKEHSRLFDEFESKAIITYTPSRVVDGNFFTPYDDRFIVQYACERNGIIISNDGYRDIIDEEKGWRKVIEKNVINYTFVHGLLMLPKDPLGPNGPTLDEMLRYQ